MASLKLLPSTLSQSLQCLSTAKAPLKCIQPASAGKTRLTTPPTLATPLYLTCHPACQVHLYSFANVLAFSNYTHLMYSSTDSAVSQTSCPHNQSEYTHAGEFADTLAADCAA